MSDFRYFAGIVCVKCGAHLWVETGSRLNNLFHPENDCRYAGRMFRMPSIELEEIQEI
jgi:hypothetical protein